MQNTTYLSFLFYFAENLHVFKIESRVYQDGKKDSRRLQKNCLDNVFISCFFHEIFCCFFYAALLRLLLKTEARRRAVPTQAELVSVLLTADNKHEK